MFKSLLELRQPPSPALTLVLLPLRPQTQTEPTTSSPGSPAYRWQILRLFGLHSHVSQFLKSINQSIFLFYVSMYLFYAMYVCVYLCICSFYVSKYLCIYISYLYIYLCICVSIFLFYISIYSFYVCMYRSKYLSIPSMYLCVYLHIYISVYLSFYSILSIHPFDSVFLGNPN